jgi:hypothetical protein
MATQEMLVIFTKNGSLASGSHKGAGTAGFFSMSGTGQHLYCTDWVKGGCDWRVCLEEWVLLHMEEESGNGVRLIAATEKVSQNRVVRMVFNTYWFLTVLSRFKALPLLVILEELHSASGILKMCNQCTVYI